MTREEIEALMQRMWREIDPSLRIAPQALIQVTGYKWKRGGNGPPITCWDGNSYDLWIVDGRDFRCLAVVHSEAEWDLIGPLFMPGGGL